MEPKKINELRRMAGLGDVVSKVTHALGIRECGGCKQRRDVLNRAVPFKTRTEVAKPKAKL
jgi:pantoate kinase